MMVTTKELNYSWLRQEKEPDNKYKWFTYYRDMKGIRRLNKIVEEMKKKEPYLESYPSYNQIKKASSVWKWKQRTVDYDNYLQIQLITSHKQTLIVYEEETINIDKKIFHALNNEVEKLIKNTQLPPDKKIKALKQATILNHELLNGVEHIANTEIPEVQYIDVEATKEHEIIEALIDNTNKAIKPEEVANLLEDYTEEEVKEILQRYINKKEADYNSIGLEALGSDIVQYGKQMFQIPKL